MSIRIGYLLPTRERIMVGQPQAAPLLELVERAGRLGFDSSAIFAHPATPKIRRVPMAALGLRNGPIHDAGTNLSTAP